MMGLPDAAEIRDVQHELRTIENALALRCLSDETRLALLLDYELALALLERWALLATVYAAARVKAAA